MHTELSKINSSFTLLRGEGEDEVYQISPGIHFNDGIPRFDTYKDHRMAMCLAPLALRHPVEINQPKVVSKSYPQYWEDLRSLGFQMHDVD